MSKATHKVQLRACNFDVVCIDWQGNPHSHGMSRLYSISLRWEEWDGFGRLCGKLGSPVRLSSDGGNTWTECKALVRGHVRLSNILAPGGRSWNPLYSVIGDRYSTRLVTELRKVVKANAADQENPNYRVD